jgi:hypothetical protein
VKCPLCAAEYTLQEALAEMPPMLIVLDPGPVDSCVMSEAAVGAGAEGCSTGMLPQVEFPDSEEEGGGLPHFADDEDVEGRVSLGDEAPAEGGAMLGGAFGADEEEGDADAQATPAVLKARRRAPKSGGGIGEMIKAVGGGVVGLSIGYYILLWLGRDPLMVKEFLSEYLPSWLLPK